MRRLLDIHILALTTLLTIVTAVVPHHHHAGIACVVMEECEQDNSMNDRHTSHHDDGQPNEEQQCSVHKMALGLLIQKDCSQGEHIQSLQTHFGGALCANILILRTALSQSEAITNQQAPCPSAPVYGRIDTRGSPVC